MASLGLIPLSEEALKIAIDPANRRFMQRTDRGDVVITVPMDNISKTKGNLITFGRDQNVCDIYLGENKYYDVSSSHSTRIEVKGERDGRFDLQGHPRRRVLTTSNVSVIGIRHAAFQLSFSGRLTEAQDASVRRAKLSDHLTRTSVERMGSVPPQHVTRVQAPPYGVQLLKKICHLPGRDLGRGSYGEVKLTLNLDSGDLLAVKRFMISPGAEKHMKERAKIEVLLLSELSHPHIAAFVHSQGWGLGEIVELFMRPCDGTLRGLMDAAPRGASGEPDFYRTVLYQMLQALVYLQDKNVVHNDLKPENILQNGNGKTFYLADFGLSNYVAFARTGCGTVKYMSPEAHRKEKVGTMTDIWSLGVVLYEILHGLPSWGPLLSWHHIIASLAKESGRAEIKPMLYDHPKRRYDAKKCMAYCLQLESGTTVSQSAPAEAGPSMPQQPLTFSEGLPRPQTLPPPLELPRLRNNDPPRLPLDRLAQPRVRHLPPSTGAQKPEHKPAPAASNQSPQRPHRHSRSGPSQRLSPTRPSANIQNPQQPHHRQSRSGPNQQLSPTRPAAHIQNFQQPHLQSPSGPIQPSPAYRSCPDPGANMPNPNSQNRPGSGGSLNPSRAPESHQQRPRQHPALPSRTQRVLGEKRSAGPIPDQYPGRFVGSGQLRMSEAGRQEPRNRTGS